ncbi:MULTISPECIES: hypothetical protein [Pseudomonas]|uniref:hypothetical protein n=1 Tax=Pseudomonas TaxID=286 RepID=UPI000CFB9FC2|nr:MULTISPECIES: hypothetical protein [Pseudomonas]PQZ91784.1 hypothetical protein CQ048_10060 [Pseudomonas trivialis]PRB27751.1 hypothetical protein CQ041_08090 [Pseudomonas sp. MYb60]
MPIPATPPSPTAATPAQQPGLPISSSNARSVLQVLINRPPGDNTFRERLDCMRADPSITSWQALTRDPARLHRLQDNERMAWSNPAGVDKSLMPLAQALRQKDVWLPEVESLNGNILTNLTTQMADTYLTQFKSILQNPSPARASDVSIVRGAPSAGKTTFLKGQFALNTDAVKNMLQDRMPGTSMLQVHDQGAALVQQFSGAMEKRLAQPLTRDALYLWPNDFKSKMADVEKLSDAPRLRFHDIQVDLATLCCRILKRGTDEAVMNFDVLSQFYTAGLEHRGTSVESVKGSGSALKEYSLSEWDGSRNVPVAKRAAGSKDFVIQDPVRFNKVTTWDKQSAQAEVNRVRGTRIDAPFIDRFTAPLPAAQAAAFREALGAYTGLTFEEALKQHAQRKPVVTSLGARVLAGVVPG